MRYFVIAALLMAVLCLHPFSANAATYTTTDATLGLTIGVSDTVASGVTSDPNISTIYKTSGFTSETSSDYVANQGGTGTGVFSDGDNTPYLFVLGRSSTSGAITSGTFTFTQPVTSFSFDLTHEVDTLSGISLTITSASGTETISLSDLETALGSSTAIASLFTSADNVLHLTITSASVIQSIVLATNCATDIAVNNVAVVPSVPLPAALPLFGFGLLGLGLRRFRKKGSPEMKMGVKSAGSVFSLILIAAAFLSIAPAQAATYTLGTGTFTVSDGVPAGTVGISETTNALRAEKDGSSSSGSINSGTISVSSDVTVTSSSSQNHTNGYIDLKYSYSTVGQETAKDATVGASVSFRSAVTSVSFDWEKITSTSQLTITLSKGEQVTLTYADLQKDGLVSSDGTTIGKYLTLSFAEGITSLDFSLTLNQDSTTARSGELLVKDFRLTQTPLPAALPMFGFAVAGLVTAKKKKQTKK